MKDNLDKILLETISQQDFAIGNDLVFIPDFEKSYNALFKQKVFTNLEIEYCERFDPAILRYASTWAAKEAVYKAIKQLNSSPISFKKIEIIRSKIGGKPSVNLPDLYKNFDISLSISHDGDYCWAVSIIKT